MKQGEKLGPTCYLPSCERPRAGRSWYCSDEHKRQYRDGARAVWKETYASKHGAAPYLWRQFRISLNTFLTMSESQDGLCAVPGCGRPHEVVDHDRRCCPGSKSCGRCVRWLLCRRCNAAEGLLGSDPNRARGLALLMEASA